MKLTLSRSLAAAALLGLATVGSVAHARTAVSFGFSVPLGGYGYYPAAAYAPPVAYGAPVYAATVDGAAYAAEGGYYNAAPAYYNAAPAYYAPAPVYYAPRVVYRPRVWVRPAPFVGVRVRGW